MVAGNSIWYLITQSDLVSLIVLALLLGMSIVCWALFLGKCIIIRAKLQQLRTIQKRIVTCVTRHDFEQIVATSHNTLPGYIMAKQQLQLESMLVAGTVDWQVFVANSQQQLDVIMMDQEQYVPLLSTSAAVAPLLGLFGTVWGLVQAFIGISQRQTADIVAVAPGIAQALITTLAGLVVAIPALVFFNYLQLRASLLEAELLNFMNALNMCVQRITSKD